MASECPICCEYYNNSTRILVKCEFGDCNYEACKSCIRQYLLSNASHPHCMKCKKIYTLNFMVMKLNRSWLVKEYKKHRSLFLLEHEISKLSETMEIAEHHNQADIKETEAKQINDKVTNMLNEIHKLREHQNQCYRAASVLRSGKKKQEKKKFIMPCPNEKCRGFLSTHYKCGICNMYTCSKCIEIIGSNKCDNHICNEDSIKSAELIRKETKPCPSCGTRISKIDGCDQMWCTECHKAFSWKTGKIDNGVVHNPHFYQFQRENARHVPRTPGDVACGEQLCNQQDLRDIIVYKLNFANYENIKTHIFDKPSDHTKDKIIDYVTAVHRVLNHIRWDTLYYMRIKRVSLNNFEKLRIDYILKKISKSDMEAAIYKNDSQQCKLTEQIHVFELLNTVGIEMFDALINSKNIANGVTTFLDEVLARINELNNLKKYCNAQFSQISVTYNQVAHYITGDWDLKTQHTKISDIKC